MKKENITNFLLVIILGISGWTLKTVTENSTAVAVHSMKLEELAIDATLADSKLDQRGIWMANIENKIENLESCECNR